MKNIKLLSILAVSSLFLGSCADNQNDTPVVDNPVKSGEEVLFGSSLPKGQIQSRTSYGEEQPGGIMVMAISLSIGKMETKSLFFARRPAMVHVLIIALLQVKMTKLLQRM